MAPSSKDIQVLTTTHPECCPPNGSHPLSHRHHCLPPRAFLQCVCDAHHQSEPCQSDCVTPWLKTCQRLEEAHPSLLAILDASGVYSFGASPGLACSSPDIHVCPLPSGSAPAGLMTEAFLATLPTHSPPHLQISPLTYLFTCLSSPTSPTTIQALRGWGLGQFCPPVPLKLDL